MKRRAPGVDVHIPIPRRRGSLCLACLDLLDQVVQFHAEVIP
jgi:hypothetical protein